MAGYVEKGQIVAHELIGPQIWRMTAELPKAAREARPGQFVHVKPEIGNLTLRRPISISGADPDKGLIEFIYRVVGVGTEAMSRMKKGDTIDSLGPLGSSFTVREGHIAGIGGGVGIAPILFLARRLPKGKMTAVIGGRSRDEVFWKDLFPDTLKDLIVTTDDGSCGIQGFTVSVLPQLLAEGGVTQVAACGPAVMMRSAAAMAAEKGVYCEVSLERRMGCGTGGCLGCVCDRIDGGHYKVCLDGPVFNAAEVII